MVRSTTLPLVDGVRVVVPDNIGLITPYVLLEQQDWFEDEIKFLRRLLQPAQRVIDIGANHGVYALSMAHTVGPTGHVWAFEPASSTAQLLADGIAANGFANLTLERSALSDHTGQAALALNRDSEMNALVHGAAPTGTTEQVPLTTLDECLRTFGWHDIHFVKIDAEGEETRILRGGARFFAEQSPLVQYEIKAGTELHLGLVDTFAALGYASYRLVPGLDLLVPFDAGATADGYLLNLFACKPDRAAALVQQGRLLLTPPGPAAPEGRPGYQWPVQLSALPYAQTLLPIWQQNTAHSPHAAVCQALAWYALSQDTAQAPASRFAALQASLGQLQALCAAGTPTMQWASLARVASAFGARTQAVVALQQLCHHLMTAQQVGATQPFLAPSARFEGSTTGDALGRWALAAALEEWERLGTYSSFYAGDASRPRLEAIAALGLGSAEMQRRLHMLKARFGAVEPAGVLAA